MYDENLLYFMKSFYAQVNFFLNFVKFYRYGTFVL